MDFKKRTLIRLLRLYRVEKKLLIFALIMVFITMGIELSMPKILGEAINYFESAFKFKFPINEAFSTFLDIAFLFILTAALLALFKFRLWYTISKLRMKILHYLRCRIYGKIQEMEFSFFGIP